jgi:TonB family protein
MPENLSLGLLPERKMDRRTLVASYGLQILLLLLLLGLRIIFPEQIQFRGEHVTELIPLPRLQPEPEPLNVQPAPQPAPIAPPVIVSAPKLIVPKDVAQPKKPDVAPPKIEAEFKPPQLQPARPLPTRIVYTGSFGSSAPVTVAAPIEKVQTGGFGAPDGLSGPGKDNANLPTAKLGSFDLPDGAGKGNGSGGAKGISGTVASAGFGNGIALGDGHSNNGTVQTAGFGAQEIAHAKPTQSNAGAPTTPIEIVSKPNPVYTDEARQLKLEGEVLLEVLFGANGQLHVNRVVRGLGHGLDEAAIAAANKIQFKPALRDGTPVDSTVVVHVNFQLAY